MISKTGGALLHDYQQRVLDKLKDENMPGLIAWHSTGSGKTLTALRALQEARERTGKPGLFITAGLPGEQCQKRAGPAQYPADGSRSDHHEL